MEDKIENTIKKLSEIACIVKKYNHQNNCGMSIEQEKWMLASQQLVETVDLLNTQIKMNRENTP